MRQLTTASANVTLARSYEPFGNLLSDGASTYAYDSANRLKTLTQGANTYTFGYNGLGDRLQQTINGTPTTYVLDLNAGLTQVLADGTNTYLYGNGRIAQYAGTTPSYFLDDALGSVRQLTNSAGQVTLAKSYQPYGSVLSSAGASGSIYGFAGEQTDATNLIFLRARFYGPQWGRFLTADTWGGDYRRPPTLNKWNYSLSNPVNYTDPSGHIACKDIISSWRPVFEALRLCNADEQPSLDQDTIDAYEAFDPLLNSNFVSCGAGYMVYGYICLPALVTKIIGTCGSGPVLPTYLLPRPNSKSMRASLSPSAHVGILEARVTPRTRSDWEWLAQKLGISLDELTNNLHSCKRKNGVPPNGDVSIDDETGDIYYSGEYIGNAYDGC